MTGRAGQRPGACWAPRPAADGSAASPRTPRAALGLRGRALAGHCCVTSTPDDVKPLTTETGKDTNSPIRDGLRFPTAAGGKRLGDRRLTRGAWEQWPATALRGSAGNQPYSRERLVKSREVLRQASLLRTLLLQPIARRSRDIAGFLPPSPRPFTARWSCKNVIQPRRPPFSSFLSG